MSDNVELTPLGEEAYAREHREKGKRWRQSVVWRIELRCRGDTGQCDGFAGGRKVQRCKCQLHVIITATIAQVRDGLRTVIVCGTHNEAGTWDGAAFQALATSPPVKQRLSVGLATQKTAEVNVLRLQLQGERHDDQPLVLLLGGGGAAAVPEPPTAAEVATAQAQLAASQDESAAAKKQARPYYPRDMRDVIRGKAAQGHKALQTASLIRKELAAAAQTGGGEQPGLSPPAPSRAYCQGVADTMHRGARGERSAYEALSHIGGRHESAPPRLATSGDCTATDGRPAPPVRSACERGDDEGGASQGVSGRRPAAASASVSSWCLVCCVALLQEASARDRGLLAAPAAHGELPPSIPARQNLSTPIAGASGPPSRQPQAFPTTAAQR